MILQYSPNPQMFSLDKRSPFVQFLSLPALPGTLLSLDFAPPPAVGLDQMKLLSNLLCLSGPSSPTGPCSPKP